MASLEDLIEAEDVRALTDLGFMAISRGRDREAEVIFDGVVAARPNNEAGYIGLALVLMFRGKIDEAVDVLRKLAPTDSARLFLGMALIRSGQTTEARQILTDLTETASGTPPAETAHLILAEI